MEKQQIIDRSGEWRKRTCAIVGNSMLNGIDERRISKTHPVKIRFLFPGVRIIYMYYYLMPILEKKPEHLTLNVGTNDAAGSYQQIVNNLLALKQFIREKLQKYNVILSLSSVVIIRKHLLL